MRNLLLPALCLPFLIGFQAVTKTYDGDGFKLKYPIEWDLNNSGAMGTSFILYAPLEDDTDAFRENLNLIVQEGVFARYELEDHVSATLNQLTQYYSDVSIKKNQLDKSGKYPYAELEYSATQGQYKLFWIQHAYEVGNDLYLLTFTVEESKRELYKKEVAALFNGFSIEPN